MPQVGQCPPSPIAFYAYGSGSRGRAARYNPRYIASSRVAATSAQGTAHEQERTSAPYRSGGTKITKVFVSLAADEPERRIPQILMSDVNVEEWGTRVMDVPILVEVPLPLCGHERDEGLRDDVVSSRTRPAKQFPPAATDVNTASSTVEVLDTA